MASRNSAVEKLNPRHLFLRTVRGYPPSPRSIRIMTLGENLEKVYVAQYFAGKIFKTLSLHPCRAKPSFLIQSLKLLFLKDLLGSSLASARQNIDIKSLTRKTLKIKHLKNGLDPM